MLQLFESRTYYLSFPAYSDSIAHRSRMKFPYRSRKSMPFWVWAATLSYWSLKSKKNMKPQGTFTDQAFYLNAQFRQKSESNMSKYITFEIIL